MMNLICKAPGCGRKEEPRGGQFISFQEEDQETADPARTWTKCETSWDALYAAEYHKHGKRSSSLTSSLRRTFLRKSKGKEEALSVTESIRSATISTKDSNLSDHGKSSPQGLAIIPRRDAPHTNKSENYHYDPNEAGHSEVHVVNLIRNKLDLAQLSHSQELEELARRHAQAMALASKVFHSNPNWMLGSLNQLPPVRLGENVFKAKSPLELYQKMTERASHYCNLTDSRYSAMGTATATDDKGIIYQCQIFWG